MKGISPIAAVLFFLPIQLFFNTFCLMKTLQVIALLLALCSTGHAQSQTDCQAWKEYTGKQPSNVLLDFSYAGYKMGEQAPPDVSTYVITELFPTIIFLTELRWKPLLAKLERTSQRLKP